MSNASEYMNVQLVVERTFDAPRDRVFRAWIDPERMIKWFAPVGMRPVNIEVEAHVGGKYQKSQRRIGWSSRGHGWQNSGPRIRW